MLATFLRNPCQLSPVGGMLTAFQQRTRATLLYPPKERTTMRLLKRLSMLLAALLLTVATGGSSYQASPQRPLPNPVLYLTSTEVYTNAGQTFVRYKLDVDNKSSYPDDLFAAAPTLPPCGLNKNSSRTWVDVLDSRGKRLYGFCALGKASDLGSIWFSTKEDEVPPSWVYIEMTDRQTGTKYKSNLAETSL